MSAPAPTSSDRREFGDFQTPAILAHEVCRTLVRLNISPTAILEPTCGLGAFLGAAIEEFPLAERLVGVEIDADYVARANARLGGAAKVQQGDFFKTNWDDVLSQHRDRWLILGNPPWVTNAELGSLGSANLPVKSNIQGHKGMDAITGKANFDISEWMLLQQLEWLKSRGGWIAMLVKTSVARKVLRYAWQRDYPIGKSSIFRIDAMRHFGAAVDACLLVVPFNGARSRDCEVFETLTSIEPSSVIGFRDELVVSDVQAFERLKPLLGKNDHYVWRSGVKHDCSKVMELVETKTGSLLNGEKQEVSVESEYIYPLLKSSDVARGAANTNRYMIVTQRNVGEATESIADRAPKTWGYLIANAQKLDARGSVIYRGKPRFAVFGVGDYAFSPWKIAISGFYKNIRFTKVGPVRDKPVVVDDTVYFLPCWSKEEADLIHDLVQSETYSELLAAMMFEDEKRPITADLLRRISIEKVATTVKRASEYKRFAAGSSVPSTQNAIAVLFDDLN